MTTIRAVVLALRYIGALAGCGRGARAKPLQRYCDHCIALVLPFLFLIGCDGATSTFDSGVAPKDLTFEVEWIYQHGDLNDVFFIDASAGWAVGPDGTILATVDGGSTWRPQRSHGEWYLTDVEFTDRDTGWVLEESSVLATKDGGKTWMAHALPSGYYARGIDFIDRTTGWIVGDGPILATLDGGETWGEQPIADGVRLFSVQFVDDSTGWAIGNRNDTPIVLATTDGGKSWRPQEIGATLPLLSIFFLNRNTGWISIWNGVYRTNDGGKNWLPPETKTEGYFESLQFVDADNGWAVGSDARLLRTKDGGTTWHVWQAHDVGDTFVGLTALHFVNARQGWAVGTGGRVLATPDGGENWRPQNQVPGLRDLGLPDDAVVHGVDPSSAPDLVAKLPSARDSRFHIAQVLRINANVIWAIGSHLSSGEGDPVGIILSTADAGTTWVTDKTLGSLPQSIHLLNQSIGLVYTKQFFDESERQNGLTWGTITNYGAWIDRFHVTEHPMQGISLRWTVQDELPKTVEAVEVEFSPGTTANFGRINEEVNRDGDATFSLAFDPADYGVKPGTALYYRVTLKDAAGLSYTHLIPHGFVYRPWWDRQPETVKSIVVGAGVIATYLVAATMLLFISPIVLLRLRERITLDDLSAIIGSGTARSIVKVLTGLLGLDYFAKRERVRRAWLARWRMDHVQVANLTSAMQAAYLTSDDARVVWLRHYAAGRASFSDLLPEVRGTYVHRPDCLDVWVERRLDMVRAAYERLDLVQQRRVWIELPIRRSERDGGDLIASPQAADFRRLFAGGSKVIMIVGPGGTGKSTLAVQIGRWALADDDLKRLAAHRMIPILIREETDDLLSTITGSLREMAGQVETEDDIVASLLEHGRLLVIVDALSERTAETQAEVCSIQRRVPINALVVTTRRALDFGATPAIELRLEHISVETLIYFLTEYLRRTETAELFPGRSALQLGERLLQVVESGGSALGVTPLFITLFTDQAVELRRRGLGLEALPPSVPEIIVEHLRRTNPQGPEVPNRVADETLVRAARVLANSSLADHFVPRDFFHDDALAQLRQTVGDVDADRIIRRLADNGVIQVRDRGGIVMLRFTLDPIAEYLAALYRIEACRGDPHKWGDWLDQIVRLPGYPGDLRGFLAALENCIVAYGSDVGVPTEVNSRLAAALQRPQAAAVAADTDA